MTMCQEHPVCSLMHRRRGKVKLEGYYRVFLGRREEQNVWIVDGEKVCLELYPEFVMGGNDQRYRFNPQGDVWIDNRLGIEELNYTIAHELIERRYMREFGWSYDRAHDEGGLMVERTMRERDLRWARRKGTPYRQRFGSRGGVTIWIVDGPEVRRTYHPDFAYGAHDLRRKYIPEGEVWLDSAMSIEEAYFQMRHMLLERALIASGVRWPQAYEQALVASLDERFRMKRRAARYEAQLPLVTYGVRERGVKPRE